MATVALLARAVQLGNPVLQIDEQFYLMVGERMQHGELPYVDHWDRKPLGLFLIYGLAALFGDGVVAYQLLAGASASATGFVIARVARRIAPPRGAAAGGVIYILFLPLFGGDGGQSPVFYNLLTAFAGLLALRCIEKPGFDACDFRRSLGVTALLGLALQVKYAVVFEAGFIGLVQFDHARRAGMAPVRLAGMAVAWITLGVAPTLLAWSYYAMQGHGAVFFDANFIQVLHRRRETIGVLAERLGWIVLLLAPLIIAALLSWNLGPQDKKPAVRGFLYLWLAASAGGVLVFGTWFDHYALPVLVPLAIVAAPAFGAPDSFVGLVGPPRRIGISLATALMLYAALLSIAMINAHRRMRGWGPQVRDIAAQMRMHPRPGGCLFVFDGDPALYRMSGACIPTRWTFPDHLSHWRERGSVSIDARMELRRVLETRPAFIVTTSNHGEIDPEAEGLLRQVLARHYALARQHRTGEWTQYLYRRTTNR